MGSAPKKVARAAKKTTKKVTKFVDKKLVEPAEKLTKKVGTEIVDTVLGIDKNDRRGTGSPTQSSEPEKSKVEPEKTTASKKVAMGGDSLAAQRLLMQKNKKFKQTKV